MGQPVLPPRRLSFNPLVASSNLGRPNKIKDLPQLPAVQKIPAGILPESEPHKLTLINFFISVCYSTSSAQTHIVGKTASINSGRILAYGRE
jgi:hypothetical protein